MQTSLQKPSSCLFRLCFLLHKESECSWWLRPVDCVCCYKYMKADSLKRDLWPQRARQDKLLLSRFFTVLFSHRFMSRDLYSAASWWASVLEIDMRQHDNKGKLLQLHKNKHSVWTAHYYRARAIMRQFVKLFKISVDGWTWLSNRKTKTMLKGHWTLSWWL